MIKAPFLPDVAQVIDFQDKGSFFVLEVVTRKENKLFKKMLTRQDIDKIEIMQSGVLNLTPRAEDFFFLIEANRIRTAYQFDPLLAVNVSQIEPLPHQIEAVYLHILENPKIRFLLADDPGAGKTIMAGLLIKELQYRNMADRILIVSPGHLKDQWQREMKEKFQLKFKLIDRSVMYASWGENVWNENNHCIASIDFLKQEDIKASLQGSYWDLVIVDEAHKLSAYKYGKKIKKTARYKAGSVLSGRTTHMLFLTATPHKGDEENFKLFLDLLSPGLFANTELLKEAVLNDENPIFLRRLKENLKRTDGSDIFPPRHVQTIKFRFNEEEKALYNSVTNYVRDYFDKAKGNRNVTFALMILQRRLSSSIYSIRISLVRRKKKLEELLSLPEKLEEYKEEIRRLRYISDEELEDCTEKERWEIEKKLEMLTIAENIEDVKAEIEQIEFLIKNAREAEKREIESKLGKLKNEVLQNLGDRKLLIFTEFRDTLEYLISKLKNWGYEVNFIHGGMNLDARIRAEKEFKHNTQIMVATEAAGEGINLQFCSFMINYDIPWNPNRLEQRMGRIHRYGQNKEVYIYNMITSDSREGQILDRIFTKLSAMREALGDRVFDVIGEIFPDKKLDEILKEAVSSQRDLDEILQEIDTVNVDFIRKRIEKLFLMSLATKHIDYTSIMRKTMEAEENKLVPEYIEAFFIRAFNHFKGEITKEDGFYTIPSVPFDIRKWGDNPDFKNRYGVINRKYKIVTFDKDIAKNNPEAEFIAPGHPLLEALNEKIIDEMGEFSDSFSIFTDSDGNYNGVIWFVEGEIQDGKGEIAGKRIFAIYEDVSGNVQVVHPCILWDLKPASDLEVPGEVKPLLSHKEDIKKYMFEKVLMDFRNDIQAKRDREVGIKEKYGVSSLEHLIIESGVKLDEYQQRQEQGEKMEMAILNEERNKENLEKKLEKLKQDIEWERNITISEPKIMGATVVIPIMKEEEPGQKGTGMTPDKDIETIGMNMAMKFERDNGRLPVDVSGIKGLGFDIKSFNKDGKFERYIEVKARKGKGEVCLSYNEWLKAKRFGKNYWLYIVYDAGKEPRLKKIQDPYNTFDAEEVKELVRFVIPAKLLFN